jgi:hypothetical protein
MPMAIGTILTYAIYRSPLRFIEELRRTAPTPTATTTTGSRRSSRRCARRIRMRSPARDDVVD